MLSFQQLSACVRPPQEPPTIDSKPQVIYDNFVIHNNNHGDSIKNLQINTQNCNSPVQIQPKNKSPLHPLSFSYKIQAFFR